MPYNFAEDSFHTNKLCSRLSSSEVRFYTEIGRFAFLRPRLGDLGETYDDHLRLSGKRVVDFLLALNELFSLGITAEALRANIGWKSDISLQRGSVDQKFHVEGVAPTNHSSQKTRLNDLSYDMKIWTDLSSILSGITRLTDWRTHRRRDSFLIARPRCMHYVACNACSVVHDLAAKYGSIGLLLREICHVEADSQKFLNKLFGSC